MTSLSQLQQLQDATEEVDIRLEEGELQHQKKLGSIFRRHRKIWTYNGVKS
jgi:hypothetical protein